MLTAIYFIVLIATCLLVLYVKYNNCYVFLLSPVFMALIPFMATFILYSTGDDFLKEKTITILSCYAIIFVCSAIASPYVYYKLRYNTTLESVSSENGIVKATTLLLLFQVLALFSAYFTLMKAISFATEGTVLYAMYGDNAPFAIKLRGVMSNENYGIPLWVKVLSQFKYINYIAPLFCMTLIKRSRKYKWIWVMSSIMSCCYPIFFLERSGILRIIALNIIFWLYWFRPRFKAVAFRIATVIFPLLLIFNAVLLLRAQADAGGGNAYTYFVGSIAGFDAFVSGTSGHVDSLNYNEIYVAPGGYKFGTAPIGQETLTELFMFVNKYLDLKYNYQQNQEYIYAPIFTNVYTALRSYYQDYHLFSIPILFMTGIIINLIFVKCMNSRSVWSGYIVAYLGYVCLYSIIANNFLTRDIIITYTLMYLIAHVTKTKNYMFRTNTLAKGK